MPLIDTNYTVCGHKSNKLKNTKRLSFVFWYFINVNSLQTFVCNVNCNKSVNMFVDNDLNLKQKCLK